MQGSSTGGKDSPLNSLWEKAISGAQKLFGSDKSDAASLQEKGEKEDRAESGKSRYTGGEFSFDTSSSFSGRRFGSFGGAAFGGNAFGSVATSRAAPDTSFKDVETSSTFDTPKAKSEPSFTQKERPADTASAQAQEASRNAQAASDQKAEDELASKEKRAEAGEAKPVQKPVAAQALVTPAMASVQTNVAEASANAQQQAASAAQTAAVPAAPQAQATSQAPLNNAPANNAQQQPAAQPTQQPAAQSSVAQANTGGENANTAIASDAAKAQLPAQAAAPAQSAVSSNPSTVKSAEVKTEAPAAPAQAEKPAQVANSATEKPQAPVAETAPKPDANAAKAAVDAAASKPLADAPLTKDAAELAKDATAAQETLGFDVAKAKDAVTDAMNKAAASKPASQVAQSTPAATPQQPAAQPAPAPVDTAPKGMATELGTTRPGEAAVTDTKDLSTADTSKKEVAAGVQQRASTAKAASEGVAQSRAGTQEGAGFDAKLGQASGSAKASSNQFARESAVAAASRSQTTGTQGKGPGNGANGTTVNGVGGAASGAQTVANGAGVQGAQHGNSSNSDGDPAAKQDFGTAMKQAATSKGSEKPLDGGQSFEAKVEAAANRRSEAAGKARQTSYVSKTASEMKEVVATLTKSIDRLVTDKTGAMNLKINFEGGGSMKLSISMEGGKVATSMQTDVVGLEGAIKANWGELANDWNAKGVKLATPHFQNSEAGKDSSFENQNEFASRQDRQADGRMGEGRGRGAGQTQAPRGFSSGTSEQGEVRAQATETKQDVISDKELKTYA